MWNAQTQPLFKEATRITSNREYLI